MADAPIGKSLESMLARLETWKPAEVAEADTGPMARLECVKRDVNVPSVVFDRLSGGETLKEIAKAWQIPVGGFTRWYMETHAELFDAADKVCANQFAHEAARIADTPQLGIETKTKADGSVEITEGDMLGHRKLQVDTKLKLAGKWDRMRYGEQMQIQHSGRAVLRVEFGTPAGAAQRRELDVTPEPAALPDGEPE